MKENLLYESSSSKLIHRVDDDGDEYVIKVLNVEFPTPSEIRHFYKEYDICSLLPSEGFRKCRSKSYEKGKHALVFDYLKGENLKTTFKNKKDDVVDFLYIAKAICKHLGDLHQSDIIHGDVNPFNIIVDLQKRDACIIDFNDATQINHAKPFQCNAEKIVGNLTYISPEQTGRMNRMVDYRSDLYSMGVCFYEMLCGAPPFQGDNALSLIYQHIAKIPLPIHEINPNVPKVISDIVSKLLQKNAEDRYKSAFGVMHDLDTCLNAMLKSKAVPSFQIGQKDISGNFLLPQKLYGREEETKKLIENFLYCSQGNLSLVIVSGYSGTGKSALVEQIHKPITEKNGYFISGKFDQLHRSTPYYAVLEAFKELIQVFLAQDKEVLEQNKVLIQGTLGQEGQVITNLLPILEVMIGPQPAIPDVGGNEAQSRFNYIFTKFVRAVCTPEHPIVLFIDDLQWADYASLQLLEVLLTDKRLQWLQCIFAYRDNEVTITHPAIQTIDRIKTSAIRIIELQTSNLTFDNINHLISDATSLSPEETQILTDLVFQKTKGNAFYTVKFLKSIADEGILSYDFTKNRWTWDIDALKPLSISENVVDFLSSKIIQLPGKQIDFLKTAACLGNTFAQGQIQRLGDYDDDVFDHHVFESLKSGLILEMNHGQYKFTHDKIQQSIYSLIPAEKKSLLHYIIGKKLLEVTKKEDIKDNIFQIVDHLNKGRSHFLPEENLEIASLNQRAGAESKLNSAFNAAAEYFQKGVDLLPADSWHADYELSLKLYTGACEAAYLNGHFAMMETYFDIVEKNANDVLEKLKCYETKILALKAQNKLVEAVKTGLDILKELGEPLPKNPNLIQVFGGLAYMMIRLRNKPKDYILNLPPMTDPYKIAAMRIIANITSSVYWATPNLLPLVVFKMIQISLKYGNNEVSCFAYGSLGVILCGVLGRMEEGNSFGEVSLELLDKIKAKEWIAQIYVAPYALTFHWKHHVDTTLKALQESFHIGLETGLIEFACINTNIYCIHSFLSGKELNRLEEETGAYSDSYKQMGQVTNFNYNEVYRQAMLNFMDKSVNPIVLTGEAYDEEKMIRQNTKRNDKTGAFFVHFLKTMLGYFFEDYGMAIQEAHEAKKLLDAVLGKFEIPNLYFYKALTLIKNYEKKQIPFIRYTIRLRKCESSLKKFARHAPMNFLHKYQLVQAEKARVSGNHFKAAKYYEMAIHNAALQRYMHEEALARELAGKFYFESQQYDLAKYYIKSAYNKYKEWGATAKLHQLRNQYSATQISLESDFGPEDAGRTAEIISSSAIDLSTFTKCAATISSEVVLSKLLGVLMNNVIENAGAQLGFLLLDNNGQLRIQAHRSLLDNEDEILINEAYEGNHILPESIISYTKMTKNSLVLSSALEDKRFEKDSYITKNHVHSILCIPIIHQSKFTGILYLENRNAKGVFTQERVELLSLLSAQIAISIENAQLYESLEQKVNDRTEELMIEKKKSDNLLYNILPYETAKEIKQNGFATSRQYESATVLFTDFQEFTNISSKLTPSELVNELNTCFKEFDNIVEKYKIEKIKTIGDAYMAVGGLPIPNSVHAENTVLAALEIRDFIEKRRQEKDAIGFQLRIGLHTGPVVSGIVGTKKFQFDIWGDTVNIASRMETNSLPGHINISNATYELIKDRFLCTEREEIEVKGKGKMKMYFVVDKK